MEPNPNFCPSKPWPHTYAACLQVLCIQGFLVCRKHADRILLLAEMMAGSGFPCFKGGARTVQQLRRRFHLNVPEAQVGLVISGLSHKAAGP